MSTIIPRVLITGSSGTIGTRLCEKLLSNGVKLVGVDKRSNPWHANIDRLTIKGDLCDAAFVRSLPKHIEIVIHLAANARVYNLVLNPDLAFQNIQTTYNVLEHCRINKIRNVVFASSRKVYGNGNGICRIENEVHPQQCESAYTASKLSGEALFYSYQKCYGINSIITRFSNVYGMYDDSDRIIPLFIRRTAADQDLVVYGKDKVLDFTYIDDTVTGLIQVIHRFETVKNSVFNIASGSGVCILDVARMIIEQMGGDNNIVIENNRTGEVERFQADISKARRLLFYSPNTTIQEGIQKSIEWYTTHILRTKSSKSVSEGQRRKFKQREKAAVG